MGYSNGDFELTPHSISHTTSSGVIFLTKALKFRGNYNANKNIFSNLFECLTKGPSDSNLVLNSNTANFELIPFANNTISSDQTTTLIQKQNDFLHNVKVISVINLGWLEGIFEAKDKRTQDSGGKKWDAEDIISDEGMEIEDKATPTTKDLVIVDVTNGLYNDETNKKTEEVQDVSTKEMEEKPPDEYLLQFLYDAEATCLNTGEVIPLFQTIEFGQTNRFYFITNGLFLE